ncbi:NTP transferase domain-containing protein [bacterium]|jgi:glucose-1-phosphate thymidylyltransferase|nr:NTP transferase domain-containing protein [bacterium]
MTAKQHNVKGIILAGGTGSRLFPLTKVTNKHLLPVGNKPMIFHPVEKLIEIGIKNILIVTGVEHMGDVVQLLGSGKDFGCQFTYKVQDEAGGIAQALSLAEHFVGGERSIVILGDNVFADSLQTSFDAFLKQEKGARLLLKEVPDPQRFGVPTLDGKQITKVTEKPSDPDSNYAVTGIYMYDGQVFDFVNQCSPSERGEMEITDVNNFYIEKGQCEYDMFKDWWTDAGTFESLRHANALLAMS